MTCPLRAARAISTPLGVATLVLGLVLSGCTFKATTKATTDVFTDFSSSTFGNPWLTGEGIIREGYLPIVFISNNLDDLQQEIARGSGEHLASLGWLVGVSAERQMTWAASLQERYPILFPSGQATPAEFLAALSHRRSD
jgi:hypothetical protein